MSSISFFSISISVFVSSIANNQPLVFFWPYESLLYLIMFYKQRCSGQTSWQLSEFWWCCLYCLGNFTPLLLSFKILTPLIAYLKLRAWLTNIKVSLLPHQSQAFYYTKGTITVMGTIFKAYKFCRPSKTLNSLNLFTGAYLDK